jgi:anion-transporting  ArsA/GET3 family ATPase
MINRRFLAVTGKGGVGKTLVAAGIAAAAAADGRRTLLCDIDATGDAARLFDCDGQYEPVEVRDNLSVMEMELQPAIVDYLQNQARLGLAARVGPLAKTFEFVATAAPGVREVLSIGKPLFELREDKYDLVVLDGPASGHVVGLLRAPDAIGTLTGSGVLGRQAKWMAEMLHDPALSGAVIVATPEELPVSEAGELIDQIVDMGIDVAGFVLNRMSGISLPTSAAVALEVSAVTPGPEAVLLDGLRHAVGLRSAETALSARMATLAPSSAWPHAIPEFVSSDGPFLEQMAGALAAEW